jgi:hypothetical protein
LRQKLERRITRFHRKIELCNYWLPLARQEDQWDALMQAQLMRREDRAKWVDVIHEADKENQALYDEDMSRDKEIIRRMQRIVDQETGLALKEGQTIVRGRRKKPIRVLKP